MSQPALTAALSLQPSPGSPGEGWDEVDEEASTGSSVQSSTPGPGPSAKRRGGVTQPSPDRPSDHELIVLPERMAIPLPSKLGVALCRTHSLDGPLLAERKLRVGQMNDALHAIRVGVGYKSFLYRHSVRVASTHRRKLRSFDEVHIANTTVYSHARVYNMARDALQKLTSASDPDTRFQQDLKAILAKYRPLEKSDLRSNTALIEQGVRGVHHLHLPWFWSLDVQGDSRGGTWIDDSEPVTCH